jgi:hypothetical protein
LLRKDGKGNALCVGLDPRWESLPKVIRNSSGLDSLEAVGRLSFGEANGRQKSSLPINTGIRS